MPSSSNNASSSILGLSFASNAAQSSVLARVYKINAAGHSVRGRREGQSHARFEIRAGAEGMASTTARHGISGGADASGGARHNILVPRRWSVYARNVETLALTFLGEIDGDAGPPFTLEDFALADGTYEIEARPSEYLWDECRIRRIATFIAGSVPALGFPAIQNLSREIVNQESVISWTVSDNDVDQDFTFGLWFAAAGGIDISGSPDAEVSWADGFGPYFYTREQTESEFIAVAAFAGSQRGPKSELALPWGEDIPPSPPNQFGYPEDPG